MTAIRVLMQHAIDYAGLFPPASLTMADAVRDYSRYQSRPDAWALGNFVIPLDRLKEFEAAAAGLGLERRMPLSIILPNADFDSRALTAGLAFGTIFAAEVKIAETDQAAVVSAKLPPGVTAYSEIPLGDRLAAFIDVIAAEDQRAKIRTGGTISGSIPSPLQVRDFLLECARARIGFKATAGLHHAIRSAHPLSHEPSAPVETMHGFLNVFLAAVLLWQGGGSQDALRTIEAEGRDTFRFHDDGVEWLGRRLTAAEIHLAREEFAIGFGSCSFEEPMAELRSLGLL